MSEVWKARHSETGQNYALKILHHANVDDDAARQQFFDEGLVQSRITHPNIVAVKGRIEEHPIYALVMEFVDGPNLTAHVKERPNGLYLPEIKTIATGTLSGLNAAHRRGIIHRDIKPTNVLLASDFYSTTPKITDFGIAKVKYGRLKTVTSSRTATPHFMSPEQLRDSIRVTHLTDIYSFGVTLYFMVTGRYPFEGDDHNELALRVLEGGFRPASSYRASLPFELDELLDRCLAPRAADRPQNCREVLESILAIDWSPSEEHPSVKAPKTRPESKRSRRSGASAPVLQQFVTEQDDFDDLDSARSDAEADNLTVRQRMTPSRPKRSVPAAADPPPRPRPSRSQAPKKKAGPRRRVVRPPGASGAAPKVRPQVARQAPKPVVQPPAKESLRPVEEFMDEPAWAMSESQGVDDFDDDLASAFRRPSRLPLIIGLLMLLAVATIGTKLFMDWRAGQTEQVYPPAGSAESVTSNTPIAEPAPTAQAEPVAVPVAADDQPELRLPDTDRSEPVLLAAAPTAPPTPAVEASSTQSASEGTSTPPAASSTPPDSEPSDSPPVAAVAAVQPEPEPASEPEQPRQSSRDGARLVGREAELAAERAWREREQREAAASRRQPTPVAPEPRQERAAEEPTTPSSSSPEAAEPAGTEDLTPIQINQTLRSRRDQFRACFERRESDSVEMRIRITPDGSVSFAGATDASAERAVTSCLVRELGRLEFDSFDGRAMTVRRTFTRAGPQ